MLATIPDEWLDAIDGGSFFYPASGTNIAELILPIDLFKDKVRNFHFCSIQYGDGFQKIIAPCSRLGL